MSATSCRVLGILYVLAGLPALVLLVTGNLERGGNAYLPLSLMGIPLGILFLVYAGRPAPRSFPGEAALKIGWVAVIQFPFMLLFWWVWRGGQEGFLLAYRFLGMFISFLSLVALVLLVTALRRGPGTDDRGTEPDGR